MNQLIFICSCIKNLWILAPFSVLDLKLNGICYGVNPPALPNGCCCNFNSGIKQQAYSWWC